MRIPATKISRRRMRLVQVHEDASKPDKTLAETAGEISRDEDEQAIEKLAASASSMGLTAAQVEGDLEESAIPILAPDFVASENIPVSPSKAPLPGPLYLNRHRFPSKVLRWLKNFRYKQMMKKPSSTTISPH